MEQIYTISRKEVYRYMGLRGQAPDEELQRITEECIQELYKVAEPKYIYGFFPLQQLSAAELDFGFMQVTSANLSKNLQDCEQAAVMAATLGAEVDRLLHRYEVTAIARCVVLQAAAAALIESVCDVCQEEISRAAGEKGYFLRPRFSPGYGDFDIGNQKSVIDVLQAPKRIGLTLTDSCMMVPTKSVTAVIGLSRKAVKCHREGCESCTMEQCAYRRNS